MSGKYSRAPGSSASPKVGSRNERVPVLADEGADVGEDDDTPVTEAYVAGPKSRFTGKIDKVTIVVK
jgi:hypothetical protein